ncbi:MAG: hypothetical protein JO153_13935 [Solirubrobacterales bacterium]|nr:hypothetical protein [Solirubrobacterales bacterium]MBV9917600.1 hypothetical protein [Solirubrobacterales bacterium]
MSVAAQPPPVETHLRGPTARARPRRPLQDLRVLIVAAWRGAALDRELAAGANPHLSALLARRAQTLTSARNRNTVGRGLARALRSAQRPPGGFTAAIWPVTSELLAAEAVLRALDLRLRDGRPIQPQGMALLRQLLTDPGSALYQAGERGTLASELRAAAAALGR